MKILKVTRIKIKKKINKKQTWKTKQTMNQNRVKISKQPMMQTSRSWKIKIVHHKKWIRTNLKMINNQKLMRISKNRKPKKINSKIKKNRNKTKQKKLNRNKQEYKNWKQLKFN